MELNDTGNTQASQQTGAPANWKWMLLLALLATLPTLPTLTLPFYGDDFGRIAAAVNRADQPWELLRSAFFDSRGAGAGTGFFRPIYEISYALDHYLFGLDANAMRAVELASHTLVSLLLARFALRLGASWLQAFFAGLIFAWAPQHIESIAWISARGSVWSSALGMMALLAFAAPPQRWSIALRALGLLAYVMASLTKELALLLPFLVFGYVWLCEAHMGLRARSLAALRRCAPLFVAFAGLLLWRFLVLDGLGSARYPDVAPPDIGSWHYWLTRLEMLGQLFVPLRLDTFPRWIWLAFAALPLALILRALQQLALRSKARFGIAVFLLLWLLLGLAPLHWTHVDPLDFERGRHLYALGLPAALLLSAAACRMETRIWSILLSLYCLVLGGLQLHSSFVYREAGEHARHLYAEMDRVISMPRHGALSSLEDLPFEHRGVPIGSVLDARLGPPWRDAPPEPAPLLHFEQSPIYRIASVGMQSRIAQLRVDRWLWRAETRRLQPETGGPSSVRVDPAVEARCSGMPLDIRSSSELRADQVLELQLDTNGDGSLAIREQQAVGRMLYVEGTPRPGATLQLRVEAPPRSQVILIGPGSAAFWRVRGIGTLLVNTDQTVAQGFADRHGEFRAEWTVPNEPSFVGAELRLQATVATPEGKGLLSACWCRKIID